MTSLQRLPWPVGNAAALHKPRRVGHQYGFVTANHLLKVSSPRSAPQVAKPHFLESPSKWQSPIFWNRPAGDIASQVAVPRRCQARRCARQCFSLTEWIIIQIAL